MTTDKKLLIKLALLWAAAAMAIVVIGVLLVSRPPRPLPLLDAPSSSTAVAEPVWKLKRARIAPPEPAAMVRAKPAAPRAARKEPRVTPVATPPGESLMDKIRRCKDDPTCGLPEM